MTRPLFYVKRGDRLIARIKHMLYAWRFARQAEGRIIMVWPGLAKFWHQFDGADYSPSLIFDLGKFYEQGGSEHLVLLDGQYQFPTDGRTLYGPEFAALRNNRFERDFFKQPNLVFYEPNLMHFCFKDEKLLRPDLDAQISRLFREIPLTKGVTDPLNAANKALGDGYVALHVRRGDIYEMLRQELPPIAHGPLPEPVFKKLLGHYVTRTAPLEMYLPHVEKVVGAGQKVAFFSDSPETFEWFAKKLGPKAFVDGNKFTAGLPIQKAMLDFTIMTNARQIISTRSNYSGLAASIGNIEHVIVSAQSYATISPDEAIELYYEQLIGRFLPKLPFQSPARNLLKADVRRIYLWLNRLPAEEMG